MDVALYTHADMLDHRSGAEYVERAARPKAVVDALDDASGPDPVARRHAKGRVVSSLEGGYDLWTLGRSAVAHVQALAET